ncbi:MAG: galactokinase, partial [Planctomycetes bacterium]|nr:galactokinase [Planctomycetota bacterium]
VGDVANPEHGWARYPIGVWREFAARTGHADGVDLVFGGDVPMASGLSSSAAIEVATVTALQQLHGVELSGEQVAAIAHAAETDYVGLQCGIMDQFASALGEAGHAVLLHCHDRTFEHVPMDPDAFEVLVVDTKKPRNLSQTEFNTRVAECAAAFEVLRAKLGPLPYLAAFPEDRLPEAREVLDEVSWRRVYHVVTEMGRVAGAVESLRSGDIARLGALISASHESTRTHYEVSCDELDTVTQAACEHERTFGARLTGAGFGGCAFALVEPDATGEVEDIVRARYRERFGVEPGFLRLRPGSGPRRLR